MVIATTKLDSGMGKRELGSTTSPVTHLSMPEHEAYRPQNEHAFEQAQHPSTSETGHALPRPENEVASNHRIVALMQERDAAERRLQEAILDLETREQSPAFQKAKELFVGGWRLADTQGDEGFRYFTLASPDRNETEITYVPGRNEMPMIIDGHQDVFKALGISDDPTKSEVLRYLVSITEETI